MPAIVRSNFDTDSVPDLLEQLQESGIHWIAAAIEKSFNNANLADCEAALIAIEIAAAILGKPAHDLPAVASEWIRLHAAQGSDIYTTVDSMREKAADSIDLITADSELRDFWEDAADFESWIAAQINLQNRILGD